MKRTTYRFVFAPDVDINDILRALMLSATAVEAIYGESAMALDGRFDVSGRKRHCLIDAETQLGADLAKVFSRIMTIYLRGRLRAETIECDAPTGDIYDLSEAIIR